MISQALASYQSLLVPSFFHQATAFSDSLHLVPNFEASFVRGFAFLSIIFYRILLMPYPARAIIDPALRKCEKEVNTRRVWLDRSIKQNSIVRFSIATDHEVVLDFCHCRWVQASHRKEQIFRPPASRSSQCQPAAARFETSFTPPVPASKPAGGCVESFEPILFHSILDLQFRFSFSFSFNSLLERARSNQSQTGKEPVSATPTSCRPSFTAHFP